MLSIDQRRCVETVAEERELEAAAVLAVIEVESGGRVFARIAGKDEPLIRWEGHYFDRLCNPSVRSRARAIGLASPVAGAVANPSSQAARWSLLECAAALDRDAAYASASWGIGQVMGSHWQALGYDSVQALVADARSGLAGQVRLMLGYIDMAGLSEALNAHDWAAFARGYNGPRFREFGYDTKLAEAYEAVISGKELVPAVLAQGARGAAVAELQRRLIAAGSDIAADGLFGPQTEQAVRAFQARSDIGVDGLAGPRTMAALTAATQVRGDAPAALRPLARLLRWLAGLILPGFRA